MASLMFLKLGDKIKGESTDKDHKEWIELQGFSWGVSQPVSQASGTGGRTAGGCSFTDFDCTKSVDAASADLMSFCAKGEHIPKAELEVVQDTGGKHTFLRYEMENVVVSNVSPAGSGGGEKPIESLSLNFGKFKQSYTSIDHTGKAGTEVTRGWNLEENQPLD